MAGIGKAWNFFCRTSETDKRRNVMSNQQDPLVDLGLSKNMDPNRIRYLKNSLRNILIATDYKNVSSIQIDVETVSPLVTANTNNDLDLSLLNHDVIERNHSLFDVYYERDGSNGSNVQAQTPAQVPVQPLANRNVAPCLPISMGVPSDAYGDIAFGSLIAGELLRMEPDAKRELKRKISQMIFS